MTTASTLDIFAEVSRILGERIGTIASVTNVTVSMVDYQDVVLNGLINTKGDDTAYAGQRLIFVSTTGALGEAFVTAWTDATGTARILKQTPAPVAVGTYMMVQDEDYTLNEYRVALATALTYTRRTYRQVVPLTPNLSLIPLYQCDWLEGAGDIDAAWLSTSSVMLHNEDFSLWQNGGSSAPDGYTLTDSGTGATITRELGGMRSAYKAHIVAGSGIVRLTQPVPDSLVAWASGRTQTAPVRWPVRPWAWVSTPDANSVRCFVYDGTTYHYTEYFDASTDGLPGFLETEYTPALTDTAYTWGVEIAAGKSADVHVAGQVQNTQTVTLTYSLKQQGSQAFSEVQIPINHRNVGGLPTLELPNWPGAWYQLVVYVRRPFPQMPVDTDVVDSQYFRSLAAGVVNFMLEPYKSEQARERLDAIRARQAKNWTRFMQTFVSLPVEVPLNTWQIVGA